MAVYEVQREDKHDQSDEVFKKKLELLCAENEASWNFSAGQE